MSKRLLSVFLVLCMLASVFSGMVAFASEPIYTTSAIFFGYVNGDAWTDATALEAGKTLTSKIEVSKTGDAEKMIFALVVYDANKLIKADSATKSVAGDKVTFDASVKLPDDVTNTHVVAVLWDNVNDMNAIANSSIFPGGSTDLEAIIVNGKAIENFDPEVKEYTYDLPTTGSEVAPVIEAIPVDGGAKVEVGEAVGFPGTVPVKVTAPGGATETYTVKYSLGGESGGFIAPKQIGNSVIDKCVWIMEDNIIPQSYAGGGNAAPLPLLVEGGLTVGSTAYADRQYQTTEINDESLIGLDKIIGAIGWYNGDAASPTLNAFKSNDTLPWVNFVLTRGATVMVFTITENGKDKLLSYGFEMEKGDEPYFVNTLNAGTVNKHAYKWSKHFKAGDRVIVPNFQDGNNTYTIALSYDPYGYVAPINHTALAGITVDGVELDGFAEDIKTYNYVLPASQKDIPVVAATTLDPNAKVVVTNPTSFPGKTTITVKCEGYEDSVYTVNYSAGKIDIKMLPSYGDTEIKWGTTIPAVHENLQNGNLCWSDRENANMVFSALDESLIGKTYINGALDWVNGPVTANYKAVWAAEEFIPDFYSFNLSRTATIKVISPVAPTTAKGKAFADSGYEASTGSTPYAKGYTSGNVNFSYMYTRKFEVTDAPVTVNMPNLGGNPYFVVIDYGTYESLEGLKPEDIPSTTLTTLTVNGVEVEGFSAAKTEYNVELVTQNVPVVAASALYKNAEVTVTQATQVPGTATVTVAAEGLETITYKINFTIKLPDGYVEGMSISNDNIEMRTTKRAGWNAPLNADNYTHVYKKTVDVEEGSTKTITLEIANKPYQKGTIILRPTAQGLEDKSVLVNADGSAIEWIDDKHVSRAYDYENYPEYNAAGVTYGKISATKPVTMGSGGVYPVYKEMFADDNRYVSGARTHNSRYPITGGTAMGAILPEWENCNYIVFENHLDATQAGSGVDNTDTVTFTVDKDVEIIFLTAGANVSVKEVGVDSASWTAESVNGINRIYMNWVDSITVAYLIYNGYITEGDVVGNYGQIGTNKELGIIVRDRSALEEFIADWKAEYGAEPIHGVQIKEADKAATGFVNDSATYHHDVFLYAWKEATGGGEGGGDVTPTVSTKLSALTIGGKAVEGFGSAVLNYTVELPAYTDVKNVVATVADAKATATVDTATDGVIKVTVKADGAEDTIYTVNYTLVNFGNIKMLETYNGSAINWGGAIAVAKTNLQVGDYCYSDRTGAMVWSKVDEAFAGKDWIAGALNWPNGGTNAYTIAWKDTNVIPAYFSFDLNESAEVTIIANSVAKKAYFEAQGWTYETDSNSYLIGYTNTTAAYNHKFSKYFDASEGTVTVEIPNVGGTSCAVVLDFEAEEPVVPPATAGATKLTALSVDGKAVAGFNADTYEYTVAIPDNQEDVPVVSFTKADEAAAVLLVNPKEFPGKATLEVSKSGEETKTYTITYKTATDGVLVSDLKLSDKAGVNSTSSVWPTAVTNLQEGDLLYLGRNYKVTTINDEFAKGKDRIMTAVGWGSDVNNNYSIAFRGELINDWISFKASRGMDVVVYDDKASDAAKFTNLGYKHTTDANNYIYAELNTNNYAKHTEKYVKHYNAGETVNIPNASGNQAYLVVLDYDNYASLEEEEPAEPVSTLLSGITVNGTAVAGFTSETYEYDVELPAGTLSAVVAATAQDSAANVTITQAAAIPGTATITVTAEGSEPSTYTINLTKELTDEDIYGKSELTITDNDVEPRTTKRGAFWNGVIGQTAFNNKYSKEFTVEEGSTKKISLDITGLKNQQSTIIVVPTGDGEDKTAVVNADGTALTWTEDKRGNSVVSSGGTIESYDYENYPEYDEAGATWAKVSSNKPVTVTFNGSPISFPVMEKLIESDGKFVNGARAQVDRRPADAAIHYTNLDDSWLGSNYIVFDNTDRSAGFTVEFTINQSAEIILISNNANVTIKETGSDTAWTKQSTSVMREHISPIDELTVAYMIYHGFLNENQFSDVSTYMDDTTGTKLTGRRIRNISAFRALQADLTEKYGSTSQFGVAMVESKREATGFTDASKDYSYKDYLYNWEATEIEQPEEPVVPVSTKLSAITVNGTAIEGFDADTLTYSVELPAGTVAATVAATTADTKATATVTQAAALPGTATITVSGEGSENTVYTVNITVAVPVNTDPVQNVTMKESYNGATINWGSTIAKYKTNLQVGNYSYSDRSTEAMKWTKVAAELQGKDWIQGALDWTNGGERDVTVMWKSTTSIPDYFTFELHKSAKVMVITQTLDANKAKPLTDEGYVLTTNTNNYLKGYFTYNYMYSKYVGVEDGEYVTVAIPNLGGAPCTVVLDYDATPEYNTNLSDLTVDGETVEGFDPSTNTYAVQLPVGSEIPVVGYTLADSNASATVVQATEIPGSATVTVSGAEGQEDNVYTINFTEYVVKKISYDDLEARGAKTHTEGTVAVLYNTATSQMYQYAKDYDVAEGETKTITLSATGLTNQFTGIALVPEGDEKAVVVKADGSDITWKDYNTGVAGCNGTSVSAYEYQNDGDEEFDADYAAYTQFSTDGVSVNYNGTAKTAWVVDKMHYSDDAFVNGAPAVTDRNPSQSGVCWVEFPADWEDCQYITFPSDGTITAGAEITFTVNAPVKVVFFTANASAQIKDAEDTENWTGEKVDMTRRYMHGVDNLSVAYMIHKGYMKESDITRTGIAFAGYAAADKVGYYLRRYDALMKMEEDFGGNYGVGIKSDSLEATGFINLGEDAVDYYIRDYSYQDFLDAWVDGE